MAEINPLNPMHLPLWARRAFVLLLPVTGPLWLLWALVFSTVGLVVVALFCSAALLAGWLGELWGSGRTPSGGHGR